MKKYPFSIVPQAPKKLDLSPIQPLDSKLKPFSQLEVAAEQSSPGPSTKKRNDGQKRGPIEVFRNRVSLLKQKTFEDLKKIDEKLKKMKADDPTLDIPELEEVENVSVVNAGVGGGVYLNIGLRKPKKGSSRAHSKKTSANRQVDGDSAEASEHFLSCSDESATLNKKIDNKRESAQDLLPNVI